MDQGIALPHQQMHHNLKVLRTTPMVYMCRNVIHHHLFGNGIEFSHRRGRVRPDPHMQEIMSDYWLPCCREMIDQALAFGFVIIRIVPLEDGLKVPVVIDPLACRIKMNYVLGLREYLVMDAQQNEIPDTHIFDLFGHSPDSQGHMTSIISNLMPEIRYINTLRGTSLVMEQKRADPILMTEAVDTKVDNVEGVNYDYYADGDMQDTTSDNRFNRDRHNVSALRNQQAMYDAFFCGWETGIGRWQRPRKHGHCSFGTKNCQRAHANRTRRHHCASQIVSRHRVWRDGHSQSPLDVRYAPQVGRRRYASNVQEDHPVVEKRPPDDLRTSLFHHIRRRYQTTTVKGDW